MRRRWRQNENGSWGETGARAQHRAARVARARMLGTHYRWSSQAKFGAGWAPLGGGRRKGPLPFGIRDDRMSPLAVELAETFAPLVEALAKRKMP